jgi:hypothetical protein
MTDTTMTYDQFGWAALPWIIAVAVMFLAIIWALIVDDGRRVDRRRYANDAMRGLDWTRYTPGRSTAATDTAIVPTYPARFLPAPPKPGPDSPLSGDFGNDDTEPLPVEQSEPAARVWPVPELLPQPTPEPVEAVLYEETGLYPTIDPEVFHSGMTGWLPRYEDYMAGAQ